MRDMTRKSNMLRFQLALVILGVSGCAGNYQEKVIGQLMDYSEQSRQNPSVRSQLVALGLGSAESINAVAGAKPISQKDAKAELLLCCPDADQEAGEVSCSASAAQWIPGFGGVERTLGPQGKVVLKKLRTSRGGEDISGVAAIAIDSRGKRQRMMQVSSNGVISKGSPYGKKNLENLLLKEPASTEVAHLHASGGETSGSLVCPFGNLAVDFAVFKRFDKLVLGPLLKEKKDDDAWLEAKPDKGCVRVDVQTPSDRLKLGQKWRQWYAAQKETSFENVSSGLSGLKVYRVDDFRDGKQEKIEDLKRKNKDLNDKVRELEDEKENLTTQVREQTNGRIAANTKILDLERDLRVQQPQQSPNHQSGVGNSQRRGSVASVARISQSPQLSQNPRRGSGRRKSVTLNAQALSTLGMEHAPNENVVQNWELRHKLFKADKFKAEMTVLLDAVKTGEGLNADAAKKLSEGLKRRLQKNEEILEVINTKNKLYRISLLIVGMKNPGSAKVREALTDYANNFEKLQNNALTGLIEKLIVAHKYPLGPKGKKKIELVLECVLQNSRKNDVLLKDIMTEKQLEYIGGILPEKTLRKNKWLYEQLDSVLGVDFVGPAGLS